VTVLSDSSPLITLGKIGLLDLLPKLYTTITITPQVYAEVVVNAVGLAGSSQISAAGWIEIKPVQNVVELAVARQRFGLGMGELSVIMLGQELAADVVLIDDLNARTLAKDQGLTVMGCVGVLLNAYRLKLLPDLPDAYRRLVSSGAYVEPSLLKNILKILDLPPL
jgi:predicted nucleic acid-binding protein